MKLGLEHYNLYLMDYGAPIGFRLAAKHPARVDSLIIQNGNAYDEGIDNNFWEPIREYWRDRGAINKGLDNEWWKNVKAAYKQPNMSNEDALKVSNAEWVSETDPESRITKMKDSRTHLAYKAEHVIDLETEVVLAAEIYTADRRSIEAEPTARVDRGFSAAADWLNSRPHDAFERWRRLGRRADIFIGGWLLNEQFDLEIPSKFLLTCGQSGLPIQICTND